MTQRRVARSSVVTAEARAVEVARAEREVLLREEQLAGRILEARDQGARIRRDFEALVARVEAADRHGDRAGRVAELARRLGSGIAPELDLDDHRERELTVREDAVRARTWLAAALSDDLSRFERELGHLAGVTEAAGSELTSLLSAPEPEPEPEPDRDRRPAALAPPPPEATAPRRQQPRVRMETDIDLHSPSNFFTGFSENLSDGGVFVATDRHVPVGTEVDLAFRLPDGVEIRGRGVVRWIRDVADGGIDSPAGLGVRFIDLGGAAQEAIERFIEARDPLFYPS